MSRERMTNRVKEAAEITKAIEALEKMLAVDDGDLADEAAAAQNDDVAQEADAVESDDAATIGESGTDVDSGLAADADAITKDEHSQVTQSLTTGWTPKDNGDQNAKANANWPITDAEREMVAARLIKLAKTLLQQ